MKKVISLRNLLLSFAIALIAICAVGAVEAKAALSYDPANDLLKSSDGTDYVYVISKAGAKIKKDETLIQVTTAGISVSAADGLGVKSTKKDVLLAVFSAPSLDKDVESATVGFTIKAQAAKKVVGSIDYTQADAPSSTKVLGATWTDANKKTQILDQSFIKWSEAQEGPYEDASTLTGTKLAGWLEAGKTIYIKMAGEAGDGKTATRTSAPVKVKIAKQKKASSVKVDVKKSTISIKNGFDFGINTSTTDGTVVVEDWYTVLPYLKDAKEVDMIVATENFVPMDKKLDDAKKTLQERVDKVSYTKNKLKALPLEDLYGVLEQDSMSGDIKLAVRKSATYKAPASAVFTCTVKGQTVNPYVATQFKYKNDYVIKQAAGSEVKFTVPDLYLGGEYTGFGDNLAAPGADDKTADANPAKFEYLVVSIKDLDTIDWSKTSWKSLKKGTKLTLGKTKVNYYAFNDKGVTTKKSAILSAKAVTEAWDPAGLDVATLDQKIDTVMLVRRAGVKGKTVDATVQASKYTITYFIKETVGGKSNMTWYTMEPIGGDAYQYTVKFALPKKDGSGYQIDESLNQVGVVSTAESKNTFNLPLGTYTEYEMLEGDEKEISIAKKADKATEQVVTVKADKAELAVKCKTLMNLEVWVNKAGTPEKLTGTTINNVEVGINTDITEAIKKVTVDGYKYNQADTLADAENKAILKFSETKYSVLIGADTTKITLYFDKADAKVTVEGYEAKTEGNVKLADYTPTAITGAKVGDKITYKVKALAGYTFSHDKTKEATGSAGIAWGASTADGFEITFTKEEAVTLKLVFDKVEPKPVTVTITAQDGEGASLADYTATAIADAKVGVEYTYTVKAHSGYTFDYNATKTASGDTGVTWGAEEAGGFKVTFTGETFSLKLVFTKDAA